MSDPSTPGTTEFDDVERRVLGSLVEKEATVPDTYPLTLNALVAACNQKNNRAPVTDHDESTVLRALDRLKAGGVVRFVHPSHGARSTKYRHVLDEHLGLAADELALVGVLLLRGPQTLSELRTRADRAHPFESLDAVATTLDGLAARRPPLVEELGRQPGQKESRWTHLLGGDQPATETATAPVTEQAGEPGEVPSPLGARVARLEARLSAVEDLLTERGISPASLE